MGKSKKQTDDPIGEGGGVDVMNAVPPPPENPVFDVNVDDLPDKRRRGEKDAPILEGYWVRIAEHDEVDEKYWNHIAAVTKAPVKSCECDWSDEPHFHNDTNFGLIVKTRDQYNAIINLPWDAVDEAVQDRATLQPYG